MLDKLQSARQRARIVLRCRLSLLQVFVASRQDDENFSAAMLLLVAYVAGTTTARDLPGVSGKLALLTPADVRLAALLSTNATPPEL